MTTPRRVLAVVLGLVVFGTQAEAEDRAYAVAASSLLVIDPASGAVLRTIMTPPVEGAPAIVAATGRAYIISGAGSRVLAVDLETAAVATFHAPCCLTGDAAIVGSTLYVATEEFGEQTLVALNAATGQALSSRVLPDGVLAVTVAVAPGSREHDNGCAIAAGGGSGGLLLLPVVICLLRRAPGYLTCAVVLLASSSQALVPGSPFRADATWSIDMSAPAALTLPIAGPALAAASYDAAFAPGVMDCLTPTLKAPCVPFSVPNLAPGPLWNRFYHVVLGIELTSTWQNYSYANPPRGATTAEVLRHLRDTMATVAAVFRRDVGAVLQIRHVRFLDQLSYPDDQSSYAYWQAELPPVTTVLRLLVAPGGGGQGTYSLCPGAGSGGHAGYDLRANPATHDALWLRNVDLIGHELSHIFGGQHTDYYDPIIERCPAQCYTGPTVCPPYAEQSWSGYCRFSCGNDGALRFGPPFAPMNRVIRWNILSATSCLEQGAYFTGDRVEDTDGDEYPDDLDNCPALANIGQEDWNQDATGDACGCQLAARPDRAAWWLLAPAALLWVGRP